MDCVQRLETLFERDLQNIQTIRFSKREVEVLSFIVHGRKPKKISQDLGISPRTVETHVRNIMVKVGCSTRESLIDFVENSGSRVAINDYYILITRHIAFGKVLEDLRLKNASAPRAFLLEDHINDASFLKYVRSFLKSAGLEEGGDNPLKIIIGSLKDSSDAKNNSNTLWIVKGASAQKSQENLVAFMEDDFEHAAINVLQKFYPNQSIEFSKNPKTHTPILEKAREAIEERTSKKWLKPLTFLIYTLGFIGIVLYLQTFWTTREHISNLPAISLPHKSLGRDNLVNSITSFVKNYTRSENRNPLVMILGIGGSGKTTLERMAVQKLTFDLIWEINAQSLQTTMLSYILLAKNLTSKNLEGRKTLANILTIPNEELKIKQLILFVNEHLKKHKWVLIFDNVRRLSKIKRFFPFSTKKAGEGVVFVASRNSNLKTSLYVNYLVEVGLISEEEQYQLFKHIYNPLGQLETEAYKKRVTHLLSTIPPFPLDIALAAYYLKLNNVPFKEYEKRLKECHPGFHELQKKILADLSDYPHTRYEIVSLSLEKIIEENPDFKKILFFISLLNHNYIPLELLYRYMDPVTVDKFLYVMNVYSLILLPHSSTKELSFISVHPSTLSNIKTFFKPLLQEPSCRKESQKFTRVFTRYMTEIFRSENPVVLSNILLQHAHLLLKEKNIEKKVKAQLLLAMGLANHYSGSYEKAVNHLQSSMDIFKDLKEYDPLVEAIGYLGGIYCDVGEYEKAHTLLMKGFDILYRTMPIRNYRYVGDALLHMGRYERAKHWFLKAMDICRQRNDHDELVLSQLRLARYYTKVGEYNKALSLFTWCRGHYTKQGSKEKIARINGHLGQMYLHQGEMKKAKGLYEESREYYKKINDNVKRAWIENKLSKVCINLGEYDKALRFLEASIKTNTLYGNEKERCKAESYLGDIHFQSKDFAKARPLVIKSLAYKEQHYSPDYIGTTYLRLLLQLMDIYEKKSSSLEETLHLLRKFKTHYGSSHYMYARALQAIANAYFFLNDLPNAEKLTNQAHTIFYLKNHPDIFSSYEALGFIYGKKWEKSRNIRDYSKSQDYFKKASKSVKAYFSKESRYLTPHLR